MSTDAAVPRLRWAVADSWVVTRRFLVHWSRQPETVGFSLLFPVLITLMFGYLFGGAMSVPDGGDYREFLMPGMFAMTMVFGVSATVLAMSEDAKRGITDRFRSMPMTPSAVIVGRAAADLLSSLAGLVVLVGCALAIGWRAHNGVVATMLGMALLLLLRFALLWPGIFLGLSVRGTGAVTALQVFEFPFGFLANTFVSPETMPGWLGTVAEWNPLSATVSTMRELFGNPGYGGESWASTHAPFLAVAWPLLITAVFLPLSAARYRRLRR